MLKEYSRRLDPRILLVNNVLPADTTLTLRIAVEVGNHGLLFEILEDFGHLYAQNDILVLARYLISKINHDFLDYHKFLQARTIQQLFLNLDKPRKEEFMNAFDDYRNDEVM